MAKTTKFSETDGIMATAFRTSEGDPLTFSFSPSLPTTDHSHWIKVMEGVDRLLRVSRETYFKVELGLFNFNVQKTGNCAVVFMSVKSHPVSKSLQRLIRQASKGLQHSTPMPALHGDQT